MSKNVNDIFRSINRLNEISNESKAHDEGLKKSITKRITWNDNNEIIQTEVDEKDFITFVKEAIGLNKYEVKFKKLDEKAVVPTYAHDGDVGMDLTAIDVEYDADKDMYVYHTGLAFETDKHYGIFLFPRSSNRKTEAYLCNHVGIADSAIYRGEIMLCFKNRTSLGYYALEARMARFFEILKEKYDIGYAIKEADKAYDEVVSGPMKYAPYKVGDKISQMVVLPYPDVKLIEVQELSETDRGTGGFGSTDVKK